VELILCVLLSQIRARNSNTKSVQALKLKSKTQKFNAIDIFLSPLANQSQKFKNTKCASFEEAEIQDSKIQWKRKRGRRWKLLSPIFTDRLTTMNCCSELHGNLVER
jgi:hypothetical protein